MEKRDYLVKLENLLAKYFWLLIIFLSIPAFWALFVPGYFGASDDLHIAWLYQMDKVIKMGQIPPRFVPDLSYGFGYPLFNFVFPFPFYLGEIFHLVGLSFVDSVKAVFLISIPLSSIFMYLLLREFLGKTLSLAGGILYVYTPYRALDLYIRGAIGEILAFVFLPLVILSVIKLSRKLDLRWLGIGGLSIGCLVLTHNITSYMFLPTVFLLGIFLTLGKRDIKNLANIFYVFLLGALISLYFWFPALTESSLVKYDTVFNFIDHFPTLKQLTIPYWGYGASVAGPYDGMSFNIGLLNLVTGFFGVTGLLIFWKRFNKEEKIILIWGYSIFIISVFLMNFRSSFLWSSIPNLAYFQFPWRFLIMTTVLSPIFLLGVSKIKFNKQIGVLVIFLAIVLNFSFFRPQDFLGRTDEYYINKYTVKPANIENSGSGYYLIKGETHELYLTQSEEYLRLPVNTKSRPWEVSTLIEETRRVDSREVNWVRKVEKVNDLYLKIETDGKYENKLQVLKYQYPGWVGFIDGKLLDLRPTDPFGQISAKVPAGRHSIQIYFTETPLKRTLDIISLFSIISALIIIWKQKLLIKK